MDARVALRLQGPTAPAWKSYGDWLREQHGWVTLWNLREDGAHGAGRAELEKLYVAPVLKVVAEASPEEAQAEEPEAQAEEREGQAQPKSKDLTPEDLLGREARCLLIRGEPGLGKSTLLRHLALRALERRLCMNEDAVQALWTATVRQDHSCAANFHLVVQRATNDPVLQPFALALIERWKNSGAPARDPD